MDIVIEFFRDTLDGPFYIVWVVVLVILIFACIGYLAEKGINNKKEKEKYATVDDTNNTAVVQDNVVSDIQVTSSPVTTPINEPVTNTSIVEEVATNSTGAIQDSGVGEVAVQAVNNSVSQVEEVGATVVQPKEVSQLNNVVTSTVVNPQVEKTINNVTTPSSEVNQVVIPTINQDGNDNTI